MPIIRLAPEEFPTADWPMLQSPQDLTFTWDELLWAAISVGRAELLHILRHGEFSLFEISYRAAILFANLQERANGRVRRSSAYDGLDPSEKSAISYFLGLGVTKAVVHRLFNVPWLMHLDVYRNQLQPVLQGGGRPDLAGQDSTGDWYVVEAKGRTNGFDSDALDRAKEQASYVTAIGGQQPRLNIGTLLHFGRGNLQLTMRDPKPDSKSELRLPLSSEDFFAGYYRPFREWLRRSPAARREIVRDRTFYVADLPQLDLSVGLDAELAEPETTPAPARIRETSRREAVGPDMELHTYVGADGVLVRTGSLWRTENMRLEPQLRQRLGVAP